MPLRKDSATETSPIKELMQVALGEAAADLAIINGDIVNVYTGEIITDHTVLIKGDKIAYVGKDAGPAIRPDTRIIDAGGKTLIPGLIDGHTHIDRINSVSELLPYAMKSGTTTIITNAISIAFALGYRGITEFLKATRHQPIKIFTVIPPMITISPTAAEHSLTPAEARRLLRREDVLGLGESFWLQVVAGDQKLLALIAETIKAGKKVEGHSSGARGNKLQAYIASGAASCHESVSAEEALEKLRLGLFIFIREGETRRELAAISQIKDEAIDLSQVALATDSIGPGQLTTDGYMDFVVQKAINLGFDPITAIQMATINPARHFEIDGLTGGIAPGKCADIVIIPNPKTIRAEYVISNGQVIVENSQTTTPPRKHAFPQTMLKSIRLPRDSKAGDFAINVAANQKQVKVRVMDLINPLVTKENILDITVDNGQIRIDTDQDILKVATIERSHLPGKTFTGLIKGMGLKNGAIATSIAWDACDIVVVGASEADMARAVNRIRQLNGGIVVCASGKIMAEIALPIGGIASPEPMGTIAAKLHDIQQAATELGSPLPDIRITLSTLTSPAIVFLRICEHGLVNLRQNKFVNLIVE